MMFWVWLLIAAWTGFTVGVVFLAGWANGHRPYVDRAPL